jgi:type IV pilus assembly protein PilN
MIRINLLPFRAARKREDIRRQVSISGLLLLLVFVVLVVWFIAINNSASDLKNQEASKTAELEGYKKELEELKNLEKMIKETQTKLDVIKELEKGKTGPVLLLSAVADAVPANKLWLTSLREGNGTLTLTGTAMDNETVALFMNNLEASKDVISAVELKSATGKEISQYKLKVSDFALECKTYAYKTEKKKAASKPKGK